MAEPVDEYRITGHAIFEMERRGIKRTVLRDILAAPEQRYTVGLAEMYCNQGSHSKTKFIWYAYLST